MSEGRAARTLATHVLDTTAGRPAAGVRIDFSAVEPDGSVRLIRTVRTNAEGRTDTPLLDEGELRIGRYELRFRVAEYFHAAGRALADPPFLDEVLVRFGIADLETHYHVPLLMSPWSYVTYRLCVPFVLRTTIAALAQLDPALLDVSRSLGAGGWFTFRRVTLPLIGRGIGAGAFLAFMASFDNIPVSLFLADERTEVLPIHLWQQIETNLDARTAAASGVIVVFTLILMFAAERLAGLSRHMR